MQTTFQGKIERWWSLLALAVVGALGTAVPGLGQETSPGPLAQDHAKYDQECARCHVAGRGVVDELCVKCHARAKTSRFHAELARESGKPCASCHRDHRGRDFPLVRWTPPKPFPHDKTGFALRDSHARLACDGCHKTRNKWGGLRQACGACHADPHAPSLGKQCQDCHTEVRFVPAARFDHGKSAFPLTGKHQTVACKACHGAAGPKARWRGLRFARCADCHGEPTKGHAGGQDCAACHVTAGWQQVSRQSGLELHQRSRLPLLGKHAEIACERCHTPARAPATGRGFGRIDAACTSCHQDVHGRRFGVACKACHGFADWRLAPGAPFEHARTGYRLEGQHRRLACSACHAPGPAYDRRFRGRDGDACTDCHADPHGGPFASAPPGDRCETCHGVQGFVPAKYGVADHDRAVRLEGAHRVVACAGCHPRVDGRPPRLHGTAQTCSACHRDPHGGQFRAGADLQPCSQCHGTQAFVPTQGFDHGRTRFALTGAHAQVACDGCHFRPAAGQPVRFTGLRDACEACHADVHAGQFRSDGPVRGCGDCHRPEGRFRIAAFDHGRTRFALDGQHVRVACAKCHGPVAGPEGRPTTLYRLGAPPCEACHKNPHDPGSAARGERTPGGRR